MMAWMNEGSLNLIFDGVLVLSILGLWVMWFQQAGQRKKVENMLQQASSDLQQATTLLDKMMEDKFQQDKAAQVTPIQESRVPQAAKVPTTAEQIQAKLSQKDKVSIRKRVQTLHKPRNIASPQPQQPNAVAMIGRLHREGLDLKAISKQLGLPVAQVKLMLLLQKAQA